MTTQPKTQRPVFSWHPKRRKTFESRTPKRSAPDSKVVIKHELGVKSLQDAIMLLVADAIDALEALDPRDYGNHDSVPYKRDGFTCHQPIGDPDSMKCYREEERSIFDDVIKAIGYADAAYNLLSEGLEPFPEIWFNSRLDWKIEESTGRPIEAVYTTGQYYNVEVPSVAHRWIKMIYDRLITAQQRRDSPIKPSLRYQSVAEALSVSRQEGYMHWSEEQVKVKDTAFGDVMYAYGQRSNIFIVNERAYEHRKRVYQVVQVDKKGHTHVLFEHQYHSKGKPNAYTIRNDPQSATARDAAMHLARGKVLSVELHWGWGSVDSIYGAEITCPTRQQSVSLRPKSHEASRLALEYLNEAVPPRNKWAILPKSGVLWQAFQELLVIQQS